MLTRIHPHTGQPLALHDLWGAWNLDPLILSVVLMAGWLYLRNVRMLRPLRGQVLSFCLGLAAVLVALVSPLDAVAGSLASAHMLQHMLLVMVAGPLLAWGRPVATILRTSPLAWRKAGGRWRRRAGLTPHRLRLMRHQGLAWLTLTAVMWVWHSAYFYGAALGSRPVHALEHATFFFAAVWFWSVVFEAVWVPRRSLGMGVILLFTMAMQGVLLSAVMTFAESPWYAPYLDTTSQWGLEPQADQQLAGLLMWIPSGLIYTGAALALLLRWIDPTDRAARGKDRLLSVAPDP